ncbi:putative mRNA (guanine-N(7)-)-methyltransferase [Rosa chinensis]|uniref:mRNA guanylyltransferase n=1 Tax=Rosa chinensis TaxID=74649 RepID=A0A2P6PBG1_ROSCH|nr:mRNA-capping enzyme [Rosa chinensis]PRQ19266.1 putative mRNA (guanine-N(7)-)-methyltransferase [Rosa chinensis]
MMVATDFDLNLLPLPEEEDEKTLQGPAEQFSTAAPNLEQMLFGVDIAHSDNQERHKRMRLEQCSDDHRSVLMQMQTSISQPPPSYDSSRVQPKHFVSSYDTSKLPSGWLDCPSSGQDLYCMIPSKVPLGESYNHYVPPGKRYSLKQVIQKQRHLKRKLGLVIDLTNTFKSRYYPTSDLEKEGIRHVKIPCKGRDSVPDNLSVNRFVYEVIRFKQMYPRKYILVHCTHGHNRTGYMIIHYLMRMLPMHTVTEAIQTFAKARPPGIYKPDYIDALYSFYHEGKPAEIVCPPTPDWKRSSEFVPDDDDDHQGLAGPLHEDMDTDIMTNDDILGDEIPPEQQEEMRLFCCQSLNTRCKNITSAFPGSHPVSLSREKLQLLKQRYYYATWKADGTRYMMLITKDGCYLIDRKFNFRRVQMRFPCKHTNGLAENGTSTHHYTLLDGEMVIDTEPGSQKKKRRYLIYDMMAINNRPVVKLPFHERWKMIEEEVIQPRNEQRRVYQSRNNPNYRYDLEPFTVRRKGFWLLSTVEKLLKDFIPKLSHDADGVIFQGWDDPYVQGADEGLLKWKYPAMNSMDFLFEVSGDGRQQLFLYERGKKKLMEGYRITFRGSVESFYSGKIIECSWDSETKEWVYMRTRTDKSAPNDINTHDKIMQSIKDNITEDVLLNEIYKTIRLPIYVHRIQKDSKATEKHASSAR